MTSIAAIYGSDLKKLEAKVLKEKILSDKKLKLLWLYVLNKLTEESSDKDFIVSKLQLLIKASANNLEIRTKDGKTALHLAANKGNLTLVKELIGAGADVNAKSKSGKTALHYAVQHIDVIKHLLLNKADPTIRDKKNRTPANVAEKGEWEISKLLQSVADEKNIRRQQRAQRKFLDLARNKKPQTHLMSEAFLENRRTDGETTPIDVSTLPFRRVITADAGAVGIALHQLRPDRQKKLVSSDKISAKLGFHREGDHNWNREKIQTGEVEVNYQHKPLPGHMGNFLMSGVGSYGTKESADILKVINGLTSVDPRDKKRQRENEKTLARLMLDSARSGNPITQDQLEKCGFQLYSRQKDTEVQINRLQRIVYLCGVKEITRRMYQGVLSTGERVVELPFAIGFVRALTLVSQGHLRFEDVFDKDATYGLPTGNSLAENMTEVRKKLVKLNLLYDKKNPPQQNRNSTQQYHEELLQGLGGASDTDGDSYSSDDDVTWISSHFRK